MQSTRQQSGPDAQEMRRIVVAKGHFAAAKSAMAQGSVHRQRSI